MQQGCTRGWSPVVLRVATLVGWPRPGLAGQELPEPRAGGSGRGWSLVTGRPRPHSPWPCASGPVERDSWGPRRVHVAMGACEDGGQRGLAEPTVSGQHCSPNTQPMGWAAESSSEPESVPAEQVEPAGDGGHEGRFQPRNPSLLLPCPLTTPLGAVWPSPGSSRSSGSGQRPQRVLHRHWSKAQLLTARGILPLAVTAAID